MNVSQVEVKGNLNKSSFHGVVQVTASVRLKARGDRGHGTVNVVECCSVCPEGLCREHTEPAQECLYMIDIARALTHMIVFQ